MTGIAVIPSELAASLVAQLAGRVHNCAGRDEIQFHWWHDPCLLPVLWDGAVRLLAVVARLDTEEVVCIGARYDRGYFPEPR